MRRTTCARPTPRAPCPRKSSRHGRAPGGWTGSAGAAGAPTARNNPAFSSTAAVKAVDPCAVRSKVAETAPKNRPAAKDETPARPVERDAEGRMVYRTGDTEIHVGGYVRYDMRTRLR